MAGDSIRTDEHECWRVSVSGRVQGVGFREACVDQASLLGVRGWVCNRADGSVEVLLQGAAERVTAMREWLRHGPPTARVERISVFRIEQPERCFDRFERMPTA